MNADSESNEATGDTVAVVCPLCVRVVAHENPDDKEIASIVETHNDQQHDGERIARRVKDKQSHINAFHKRVRSDHGPEVAAKIAGKMADVAPWSVLDE